MEKGREKAWDGETHKYGSVLLGSADVHWEEEGLHKLQASSQWACLYAYCGKYLTNLIFTMRFYAKLQKGLKNKSINEVTEMA